MSLLEQINGYKTYISSALIAIVGLAYIFNYINGEQFAALLTLFGAMGLAGVRDALNKIKPKE